MSDYHSHQMLYFLFRWLNKQEVFNPNGPVKRDPIRIVVWGMGRVMTAIGAWMLARAGQPVITIPVQDKPSTANG